MSVKSSFENILSAIPPPTAFRSDMIGLLTLGRYSCPFIMDIPPANPLDYAITTAIVFIIISAIAIVIYARKHPSQIHKAGMADKQVQDQINKNE